MQPTLFFIPHHWLGWPLLVVWLLISAIISFNYWRRGGWSDELKSFLPMVAMVTAGILFVLPAVEVGGVNPEDPLGPMINRGLAVRGYGLCMLLAIVTGMGIVLWRCRRIGFPVDPIFTLAFCMVIAGVIGARLFYVIQKHDQFFGPDIPLTLSLQLAANMTGGGLVVYGSLFGASIAAFIFFWWSKLPVWKTADLMAPGMAIGLAIGRLGCLMNGCCWGGVCDAGLPAIQFPAGSSAWVQHLSEGALLGLETKPLTDQTSHELGFANEVVAVGHGLGKDVGVAPGDAIAIEIGDPDRIRYLQSWRTDLADQESIKFAWSHDGEIDVIAVPLGKVPARSLPVHPTQIYSSVNALLLCLLLWMYWYHRRSDGEVFALMLILYPIGRFMIETIRNDEAGQFGTEWTISQWVSMGTIVVGFAIFSWCRAFGQIAKISGDVNDEAS